LRIAATAGPGDRVQRRTLSPSPRVITMLDSLRRHWPEYLMEAAELGAFMVSASLFTILLEHPASPLRQAIGSDVLRRGLIGAAMGLTAIAIVYSPWGQRSGAHFNPAFTLTFWRLGKVRGHDTLFYVLAQFAGGAAGVGLVALLMSGPLADPAVNYVATLPGPRGRLVAFAAEALISFGMMLMVLHVSNHRRLARYTPLFVGTLVAAYILIEAPLSGMSMNPARTLGSALPGTVYTGLWIYFTAPLLGMLLASEAYLRLKRGREVHCAKLHHANDKRCIFRCNYAKLAADEAQAASEPQRRVA
jgi:aquaporin Z